MTDVFALFRDIGAYIYTLEYIITIIFSMMSKESQFDDRQTSIDKDRL